MSIQQQQQRYPASIIQEQFWLLDQLQPDNPAYNIPSLFTLKGHLDAEAFRQSIDEIISRHDILRTTFSREADTLYQVISQTGSCHLRTINLSAGDKETRLKQVRHHIHEEATLPFDLENGPLLRISLYCLGEHEYQLLIVMHHIITDLHSKQLFSQEFSALHHDFSNNNPPSLSRPALQYKDFADWQHNLLKSDQCRTMSNYWQKVLKEHSGFLNLPTDRSRPPVQTISGKAVPFELSQSFTAGLTEFSRSNNSNIFLILLTAYFILLYRYTNQKDLIIGVPLTNRRQENHKNTMGCFVNILPIAIKANPNQSFKEILQQVRLAMLGAHRHQEIPYSSLIKQIQLKRDAGFNPLFQTGFTFEPPMELQLHGLEVTAEKIHTNGTQLDLFFTLWEQNNQLRGFIEFNNTLLDTASIERLLGNYRTLLQEIVTQPRNAVGSLNILTPRERKQLDLWNDTAADLQPAPFLHELFEKQVERTPDNIAVISGNRQLTYRQLNNRANQLAHYLQTLAPDPKTLIGVFMERSEDMLVVLYAILKSGGAYVPLDPAFPRDRIAFMLEDTALQLVITERKIADQLPPHDSRKIIIDSNWSTISKESTDNNRLKLSPTDLAYVIYTSGSSGKPKGVQVPHLAAVNFLLSMGKKPGITEKNTLLAVTTLSFDISVLELFLPLTVGAKTVLADRETASNGELLLDLLEQSQAAIMQATPTTWYLLMAAGWQGTKNFKILCGGEPLPKEMISKFTQRSSEVWNMYGPTETTVWSTCHKISETDGEVLVGKPIDNTRTYIVNDAGQLNPVGVAGELLIGGTGVTRGYLNRPELTAKNFIPDTFSTTPARHTIYRTGDLACYRPDGTIKILGRIDNQVKLRGYRIEPGEIEVVLENYPAIKQAAVIVREDEPGDKRLTAYIILDQVQEFSQSALRQHLKSKLPEYMIPALFVPLQTMPLTLNGKIDRRNLPRPESKRSSMGQEFTAPSTRTEKELSALWAQTLHLDQVGIHDNFFDVGGNSMLSVQLVALIEKKMGRQLPLVKFYQYPTVASQAEYLCGKVSLSQPEAVPQPDEKNRDTRSHHAPGNTTEEIAVIGMAGRFPGAKDIDQLWKNLVNGVESILSFSDEELLARGVTKDRLSNPQYVKAGTILDDAEMFDASFFGYNRREAELMDPQQRVFLELAWSALESAGYNPDNYDGAIGVFAGTSGNDYRKHLSANLQSITSGLESFELIMGNDPDFLTTRVSYKLNLKGPSFTIQTACSTSLVAVHQACQHLLTGQCEMALAGGVCIRFPQGLGYLYQEGMIWSPDGHCRPFDAKARGTLFGHGAGIVVLKRLTDALQDNDTVLAVIKGSAINNDGAMKVGFTAPGVNGQREAITAALARGKTAPDTISYIEAHGTGTPLGDPIEIEALTEAFREQTEKKNYCTVGSIKANIGHLDAAAGIAGLIKTVQILRHGIIPAPPHFTEANPNIDFANSPFYVNTTPLEWPVNGQPHRAGVSSFGIGGTNAHVVLEEAPDATSEESSQTWHLLPLSAKSETALQAHLANITSFIKNQPNLSSADAAWTLQHGRKHFKHRNILTISNDSRQAIPVPGPTVTASKRDIVFMFSGQGSQYVNMGRDLYRQYPVFKKQVDLCAEILHPLLGLDIRMILFPPQEQGKEASSEIHQTYITQPALFTIEYSLATLWNHFDISPAALVGHSIGEYTAACVAGVFSLEDTLKLVAARGRLMQSLPPGAMMAVPLSEKDVQPYLSPQIGVAVVNSASMTVVSGETEQIDKLAGTLAENGIEGRILRTSHAFHSSMMDPILGEFEKEVAKAGPKPPRLPFVSNLTGTWITNEQVTMPSYWTRHLRHTVNFYANAGELLDKYANGIMLEVGPGQTLNLLTRQHPAVTGDHVILASTRRPVERKNDVQYFLHTLGRLWANGCRINWHNLYEGEKRRRIALPTYPFERKRYWLQEEDVVAGSKPASPTNFTSCPGTEPPENAQPLMPDMTDIENVIAKIWLATLPGLTDVRPTDSFYDLGGESMQAVQMLNEIEKQTGVSMLVSDFQQAPVLKDFALLVEQRSSTSGSAAEIHPFEAISELPLNKKLLQALRSPVKHLPRLFALLRGTWYILRYRLPGNHITIKFPFYAHTRVDIQGPGHVTIDKSCGAYPNGLEHLTIITLHKDSVVEIGNKCDLAGLTIRCRNSIKLGDRVLTARNLIQDVFLFSSEPANHQSLPSILIGDDTWLAMQSTVLAGSNIGQGAVLAAQAILYNSTVDKNTLAAGSPVVSADQLPFSCKKV